MPSQKQEEFKNYLNSVEFVYSSIEFIDDKEVVIVGCESPDIESQLDSIYTYLNKNDIIVSFLKKGVILENRIKFIF
jgi:hypothetical protein